MGRMTAPWINSASRQRQMKRRFKGKRIKWKAIPKVMMLINSIHWVFKGLLGENFCRLTVEAVVGFSHYDANASYQFHLGQLTTLQNDYVGNFRFDLELGYSSAYAVYDAGGIWRYGIMSTSSCGWYESQFGQLNQITSLWYLSELRMLSKLDNHQVFKLNETFAIGIDS